MRHSHILLIILYFFSTSCSSRDNKKLALALEKAKENTSELLKVIEHYKHDSDTLKYAAALFLIENMSYHYGGYSKNISLYNPQIEMFAHFKTKSSFHKTKRII